MCGVAGKEHSPDPIVWNLALVTVESGHPAGVVHTEVGAQHALGDIADFVQLDRRVVWQLPAPVPGDDRYHPSPNGARNEKPSPAALTVSTSSGASLSRTSASITDCTAE